MNAFNWPEQKKIYRQPGKLKYKVPMQKKVVTEDLELYEYYIVEGKVKYRFLSFLRLEA